MNEIVMDHLTLSVATINHNKSKLLSGVLEHLKGLDLQNVQSRKVFFELLSNVCNIDDDSLDDDEFMRWLSKRKEKRYNVMKAMKSRKCEARGSRTAKDLMTHQAIYHTWHDFSKVTVDR